MLTAATLALSLTAAVPLQGSMIAVDPLGRGTWVVDADRDDVVLLPEGAAAAPRRIRVGRWPQQLVVAPDGRVFVACRQDGVVEVLDDALHRTAIAVGAEPRALALDVDAHRLYVGLVTQRAVAVVDTLARTVSQVLPLNVEPTHLALYGADLAVLPRRADAVTLLSTLSGKTRTVALTEQHRKAWHGFALTVAGDALVVVHAAVDTGLDQPVASGGYGGSVSRPIELVASVIRDGAERHAPAFAMGRALHLTDCSSVVYDRGFLIFTGRGDGQLRASKFEPGALALSEDFGLHAGPGAMGVAATADGTLRVATHFGERVVTFRRSRALWQAKAPDLAGWSLRKRVVLTEVPVPLVLTASVGLEAPALPEGVAEGRALFHDTRSPLISGGSGLSCATCHPDGREDGLVWRLKGTRRQTPLLAGRLEGTAPFNWEGSAPTLRANLHQTVKRLGGSGLSDGAFHRLEQYLRAGLRAPTLPPPADPALVARGAAVFHDDQVGCAACHVSGRSDGETHDVGSLGAQEAAEQRAVAPKAKPAAFDTPSLRYLSLTAPYFHDGQAQSLEQFLTENGDKMGDTRALSAEDRKALAAYLASL